MVNRNLLATKLAELADRLDQVRKHRQPTLDALRANRDAAELVAFNLMLAVQVCSDIASHVISDEGWAPARTLGEGFKRLSEHGVIPQPAADSLRRAAGLRNVIAHGYAGVDWAPLQRASTEGVADLDDFARSVAAWAQANTP